MGRVFLGYLAGLATIPLVAVITAWLGWWPVEAAAAPSALEAGLARAVVSASVAHQAPRVMNPIQPTVEELLLGLRIYRNNCAGCHGDGHEPSDWGKQFYPRVPQFAEHRPTKPDWQLFWILKNGVRYSGMGGWDGQLPDERLWRAVTFLSHLDSLPAIVDSAWHTAPPQR